MQLQQPGGERTGQRGTYQHTDAGQRHGWPETDPEVFYPGTHTAVQQDNRQRQAADQKRAVGIFKLDAPDAIDPSEHADDEEDQQQRNAQARRQRAGQDAKAEQHGTYQE